MQVTIDHQDGTKTAFFGVSDYPGEPDGEDEEIELHFFRSDAEIPAELNTTGEITSVISEQALPIREAIEHIANIAPEEGTTVYAVPTSQNRQIINAIKELQEDEDYEYGDSLTIS